MLQSQRCEAKDLKVFGVQCTPETRAGLRPMFGQGILEQGLGMPCQMENEHEELAHIGVYRDRTP